MKIEELKKLFGLIVPCSPDDVELCLKYFDALLEVATAAKMQHCGNPDCGQHGTVMGRALKKLEEISND